MSFLSYLKLELFKIKTSFIKYVIIAPVIISALMNIANLIIRKEVILINYNKVVNNGFYALIIENHLALIWPILLLLSVIITSVSLFHIDVKDNLLTHILACPIKRSKYYLSKVITILITSVISIIMEGILLIVMNSIFDLSDSLDIGLLVRYMWFQFFSVLGLIGLQGFLFSILQDIAPLITLNIVGLCMSIPVARNPSMMKLSPYLQLANSMPFSESNLIIGSIAYSIFYMFIFTIIGIMIFNNRDIKGEQ